VASFILIIFTELSGECAASMCRVKIEPSMGVGGERAGMGS
jgi:hypothetical protein